MTIKFLSLYKGYEIKSDTWKCSFLEKSVKKKKVEMLFHSEVS